jgi:4a-hydroxytetrahydrobiopterin dehydratase
LAMDQIRRLQPRVTGWGVIEKECIPRPERIFRFKDFRQARAFTNRVGTLAEGKGHHRAILTEYGKMTVTWWTHKIRGLHQNDLIMSAKTAELYERAG